MKFTSEEIYIKSLICNLLSQAE